MKKLVLVVLVALAGCAHRSYRSETECGALSGSDRLACSACVLQNEAQGWLGVYEYRPDNKDGDRCVKVK